MRLRGPSDLARRLGHAPQRLELIRNAAADLGLLPLLSRGQSRVLQKEAPFDVPRFVAEVVKEGFNGASGVEAWKAAEAIPTVSDTIVIPVGPKGDSPEVTIKVALGPRGGEHLRRERTALAALRSDPRVRDWCAMLPTVLGEGEISGRRYLVEGLIPGVEAKRVLGRGDAKRRILTAAARTITHLHRETCSIPTPLDGRILAQWVDEPIAALREATAGRRQHGQRLETLGELDRTLREALAGKALARAWVHGDFVPQNIFVTPDGRSVTGIVDWDRAVPDGLPQLDAVHLLLGTRVFLRRREVGQIVRELLREPKLDECELEILEVAWSDIPGDRVDFRPLVLLCWLQHTAGNLDKSDRYRNSWVWLSLNVDTVLGGFTAE